MAGFPKRLYEIDTQGWGQHHHYLTEGIRSHRPSVVVEVGVWKGASSLIMAEEMRKCQIDGVIICVDTWLGAADHWQNDDFFAELAFDQGYPSIQKKFMANVLAHDLQDYILPLPLDSINAAAVLKALSIRIGMLHLDGGHEYESVASDLRSWWPVLDVGGLIIGDDYYPEHHWPGVKRGFDEFFLPLGMPHFEQTSGKCRLTKTQ